MTVEGCLPRSDPGEVTLASAAKARRQRGEFQCFLSGVHGLPGFLRVRANVGISLAVMESGPFHTLLQFLGSSHSKGHKETSSLSIAYFLKEL